jgi:very-short-patch-repair endonuclease
MDNNETIEIAREFRKNPTNAEKILWQQLRGGQLGGNKFRRQHPLGGYILDFYCAQARLAIEVDGGVHQCQANEDAVRSENLAEIDVEVIRFWNGEVESDMDGVKNRILKKIEEMMGELQK